LFVPSRVFSYEVVDLLLTHPVVVTGNDALWVALSAHYSDVAQHDNASRSAAVACATSSSNFSFRSAGLLESYTRGLGVLSFGIVTIMA
jgi:hypothetical protein